MPDSEIAGNKRAIDGFNQRRNDAIERIHDLMIQWLANVQPQAGAWLKSETAGSIIDRLFIVSLKILHRRLQTQRDDVTSSHIDTCQQKLERLIKQRSNLQSSLDAMLNAAARGDVLFKIYRQFKMYNDPTLNPYLYGKSGSP